MAVADFNARLGIVVNPEFSSILAEIEISCCGSYRICTQRGQASLGSGDGISFLKLEKAFA